MQLLCRTFEQFLRGKHKSYQSEVAQSCPTLCDPVDCSLPGSSVHGILQARILEWIAISFSRGSSPPRDWTLVSRIAGRCFNLWSKVYGTVLLTVDWSIIVQQISRTHSLCIAETLYPLNNNSPFPPLPAAGSPHSTLCSVTILDISHKGNHSICLWLTYFT